MKDQEPCQFCGQPAPRFWDAGESDGGWNASPGYYAECADQKACRARCAALRAARSAEAAKAREEEKKKKEKEEEEHCAKGEAFKAEHGLVACSGYDWSWDVLNGGSELISGFYGRRGAKEYRSAKSKCGAQVMLSLFGNACVLWAPSDVIKKAWEGLDLGKEDSDEFLAEYGPEAGCAYGPCAGWEARAWAAGRLDLLAGEI